MRLQSLLKENILLLDQVLQAIEAQTDKAQLLALYRILNYYEAFIARKDILSYATTKKWTKDQAITQGKALMSSLLRITEDDWLHVDHAGAKCPSSVSRELAFLASKASEVLESNGIYKEN